MRHFGHLRRGFVAAALAFALLLLAGCGSGPRLEGTVTFDGLPVDGGTIALFPVEDAGGSKRGNVTGEIKEGKYSLDSTRDLQAGKYRVEIHWHKKTGRKLKSRDDPGNTTEESVQVIPKQHNQLSKTTVDITSGRTTKDFDLKSKG